MTYNHAAFIKEAMDGIIRQRTNFLVEVVVGDDFSQDDTLDIINSYCSTENIQIVVLRRTQEGAYGRARRKSGRLFNFVDTLRHCKGKYIALLDGDDYWTDPFKLQKQVDFMDLNENCCLCAHNASVLDDEKGQMVEVRPGVDSVEFFNLALLQKSNPFATGSIVIRRQVVRDLPPWFVSLPFGDYGLLFLAATKGSIACLPYNMSTYRIHAEGIHSKAFETNRGAITALDKHYQFLQIFWNRLLRKTSDEFIVRRKMLSILRSKCSVQLQNRDFLGALTTKMLIGRIRLSGLVCSLGNKFR